MYTLYTHFWQFNCVDIFADYCMTIQKLYVTPFIISRVFKMDLLFINYYIAKLNITIHKQLFV